MRYRAASCDKCKGGPGTMRRMTDVVAEFDVAAAVRDEGFAVVRGAIDAALVERLRAAFRPGDVGPLGQVDVDDDTPGVEAWRALGVLPIVHEPIVELLGGPTQVRFFGRSPAPGLGDQRLHADAGDEGPTIVRVASVWMLDDFDAENGATRIVPGSHLHRRQPDGVRHPDEVVVTGLAGDVLLFDAHLWHAGGRNVSQRQRRSVQMFWSRLGAAF